MRWRIVVRVALLLLAGAIITIIVAWAATLTATDVEARGAGPVAGWISRVDAVAAKFPDPAPVLVEVDHLVHRSLHPGALVALLSDIESGAYDVVALVTSDYSRVRELCDRYADADIGFVDASVLAVVERLEEDKLATLDHRHFGTLRPRHVDTLRLLPD